MRHLHRRRLTIRPVEHSQSCTTAVTLSTGSYCGTNLRAKSCRFDRTTVIGSYGRELDVSSLGSADLTEPTSVSLRIWSGTRRPRFTVEMRSQGACASNLVILSLSIVLQDDGWNRTCHTQGPRCRSCTTVAERNAAWALPHRGSCVPRRHGQAGSSSWVHVAVRA